MVSDLSLALVLGIVISGIVCIPVTSCCRDSSWKNQTVARGYADWNVDVNGNVSWQWRDKSHEQYTEE